MQAIQRLAQVGAPGVGIYDIDPRDFEAPRTELLINGLTDGEDYDVRACRFLLRFALTRAEQPLPSCKAHSGPALSP